MIIFRDMEKTTLISVRLDNAVIEKIKELQEKEMYLTRSHIINTALAAVLFCMKKDERSEVLRLYDPYDDGVILRLGYV